MNIEVIEVVIVLIVIFFQLRVFIGTFKQITLYRHSVPELAKIKISKFRIAASRLQALSPETILEQLSKSRNISQESNSSQEIQLWAAPTGNEEMLTISVIEASTKDTAVFGNVEHALNRYLIRNHGAATDFNLVKDVVERNIGALEEDINLTLSVPLYLGLMGTMIGIVIGLFNIPDLNLALNAEGNDALLSQGISLLIGGVKVAMIASFVGLLLTIISSSWLFKGSRSLVEYRKNDFYTFVQTELLPVLNQSMGSTFSSLQRNLLLFNNEFGQNLEKLSVLFTSNYEAIVAQERVLNQLEHIDLGKMAKFNITVLQELQKSTKEFQQFNQYLNGINSFVASTQRLAEKAESILQRTDNFGEIADNLEDKLDQSQALLDFLSVHFKDLEGHKALVGGAVADVGHYLSGTFEELKQHIQNSTDNVRQFTVDEVELLKNALSESRTNLGNLSYLESLNRDVSQFKSKSASQGDRIGDLLTDLQQHMQATTEVLKEIKQGSFGYRMRNLFSKEKK